MFERLFGKRKSISEDRLAILRIDYGSGYFSLVSDAAEGKSRALFCASTLTMLKEHGVGQDFAKADLTQIPANVLAKVSLLHSAILGEPAEAEEALQSLGPVWSVTVRQAKERIEGGRTAAAAATQFEIALVSGQVDLIEVLDDIEAQRDQKRRPFSEILLDWLTQQSPDPDLWHDIATGADPDGMAEVFEWIVLQRDCDAATAAYIFHVSGAFDLIKFRDEHAAGMYAAQFRTVVAIINRWRDGSFPSARFSFDPVGRPEPLEIYVAAAEKTAAKFGKAPFNVPATLLERRQGERTRSRYFFNGQGNNAKHLERLAQIAAKQSQERESEGSLAREWMAEQARKQADK